MSKRNSAYSSSSKVTWLIRVIFVSGFPCSSLLILGCGSHSPVTPSQSGTGGTTAACAYQVDPTTQSVSNTGGGWTVNVRRVSGSCSWSASTDVAWITFPKGSSGFDTGTLEYRVDALHETNDRSGHVNVTWTTGSTQVTVNQSGFRVQPGALATLTVSGIVAEEGHAIADAGVSLDAVTDPGASYEIVGLNGEPFGTSTDATGRYRLTVYFYNSVPQQVTLWGLVSKDGYVQQCATTKTVVGNSATLDLRLTSIVNLSSARPKSDPGTRAVSGIVFKTTASGPRPIEGATVGWFAFDDNGEGMARTVTDAAGFYLLCGLPQTRIVTGPSYDLEGFFAEKEGEGYASNIPVVEAGTGDVVLNIELNSGPLGLLGLDHPSSSSVRRVFKKR